VGAEPRARLQAPGRAAGARLQLLLLLQDDVHELALVALTPPPPRPSGSGFPACTSMQFHTAWAGFRCGQHAQTLIVAVADVEKLDREVPGGAGLGGSAAARAGARQQRLRVRGELGQRDAHAVRPARDAQPAQLPVDDRLAHVQRDRCVLRSASIRF